MTKIITIFLTSLIFYITDNAMSQSKPSISFFAGLAVPSGEMKGDLVMTTDSGLTFINSDFIKNNYAASTGITVSGTFKIPLDKKGFVNGIFLGSYTYFNAFTRSILGTTVENGLTVPVSFDNKFSATTFGLGIELTPVTSAKISPYINSEFTFNILSLSLLKNDFTSALFNDAFRMGLNTGAGISFKINSEYKIILGGTYHMSNLFLKSTGNSYNERVEFGRENIPLNDEEGLFYSGLSDPDSFPEQVNGIRKSINWWNVNIGLNIELGISDKK